jgi:hypothetical protein
MFVTDPGDRWLAWCRGAERFFRQICTGVLDPDETVGVMKDLAKQYFVLDRDPEGWHLVQAILFVLLHADDRGAR